MRCRLVCLDAGFTVPSPVRSLSEALDAVLLRRPGWRDRREPVAPEVRALASPSELPAIVLGRGSR